MTDFSREVDSTVVGALNPGEELVWTGHCLSRLGQQGKAGPGVATPSFVLGVAVAVIFALPVAVFTREPVLVFWVAMPVFLVTVMKSGTFFHEWGTDSALYCRKQTVYVLTDQRAFILRHCRTDAPMRSVPWRYIDHVQAELVEPGGRGTVKFRHWDVAAQRWDTLLQFSKVGNATWVAEWAQATAARARG